MAHHGWGHSRYGGWGGGFGFGGLIPGLLLGELLSDGRGRSEAQPWPPAPQAPPATNPAPQPQANLQCWNCGSVVTGLFTFCPQCGERLDSPACRYCGQALDPKAPVCAHCGAPTAPRH